MTDHEAQELLRLSHAERKLRGYLKAFADELDALACSLGHRAPDRVAADMRDISTQMEVVAGVPEVEVMGRHGHASASSMKPYRHYIRAKDRISTEAMRDVLDGSPRRDK